MGVYFGFSFADDSTIDANGVSNGLMANLSSGASGNDAQPQVTRQTTVSTYNGASGNGTQAMISSNTNINLSCNATIKTTTSITLIYSNDDGKIVKKETNLVASEQGTATSVLLPTTATNGTGCATGDDSKAPSEGANAHQEQQI